MVIIVTWLFSGINPKHKTNIICHPLAKNLGIMIYSGKPTKYELFVNVIIILQNTLSNPFGNPH